VTSVDGRLRHVRDPPFLPSAWGCPGSSWITTRSAWCSWSGLQADL